MDWKTFKVFPARGEIWRAELDPVRGHEQGRTRPVLIVSNDLFNRNRMRLVTVVPITSRERPVRAYLEIDPPEGGLKQTSFIICNQIRTVSVDRLQKRLGIVSQLTLTEVEMRLRFLLDL